MKTKFVFVVITGMALFLAACSEKSEVADEVLQDEVLQTLDPTKSSELAELVGDSCNFTATLNEEEVEGLLAMREEEKLARDVYRAFYAEYGHIVFSNISKSEDAHMTAVLYMINGFGLIDPASDEEGAFNADPFPELYAQLTEQGSASLVEALKVGAFIEEYDIADLRDHLAETENETIQRVYGNLLRGSTFHLRAFTNALSRLGETYTPGILTQEDYEDLLLNDNTDSDDSEDDGTFVPGTGVCDGTGPNA